MIRRQSDAGGRQSEAIYSTCERYRYALTRVWDQDGRRLLYVMLNPSKATEAQNDPTIERCERRARALGYGGFRVCNLFAYRETDPKRLRAAKRPSGPDNGAVLREAALWCDDILCGWGVHGAHLDQGAQVAADLRALCQSSGRQLFSLGLTKEGHPRHPLYIAYKTPFQPWQDPYGA